MRLLMYSQDGAGLGHLRRAGNIAQEVLARDPDSDVLIMSDSPTTPLLPALRGLDYVKLPTIVKCGRVSSRPSSWRSSTLSIPIEETLELRSRLMAEISGSFRPDAILIDHMPLGALGELRRLLTDATRSERRRFWGFDASVVMAIRTSLEDIRNGDDPTEGWRPSRPAAKLRLTKSARKENLQ